MSTVNLVKVTLLKQPSFSVYTGCGGRIAADGSKVCRRFSSSFHDSQVLLSLEMDLKHAIRTGRTSAMHHLRYVVIIMLSKSRPRPLSLSLLFRYLRRRRNQCALFEDISHIRLTLLLKVTVMTGCMK